MSQNLYEPSFDELVEEFQGRLRRGEKPTASEYLRRYPRYEKEISEIFSTIIALEQIKEKREQQPAQAVVSETIPLQQIGEYQLLREIGRGGMGIVYEAFQPSLQRSVAIKVLPRLFRKDQNAEKRFIREAKLAGRLHYPHIIPIYDFGIEQGYYFYVMQYVQGLSLTELTAFLASRSPQQIVAISEKSGPLGSHSGRSPFLQNIINAYIEDEAFHIAENESDINPMHTEKEGGSPIAKAQNRLWLKPLYPHLPLRYYKEIASCLAQVAEALHYAHEQKAIHRDIKPSNLIIDHQGMMWIADFGLAKEVFTESMTATGDILGTVRYMAPEFFNGECDARSDLYSLGLTLYELLTLCPAYPEQGTQLIKKIAVGRCEPPRLKNPHIPIVLDAIVGRASNSNRELRFPSGATMARELRQFSEKKGKVEAMPAIVDPVAVGSPDNASGRWWQIITAAGIVVLILAFWLAHKGGEKGKIVDVVGNGEQIEQKIAKKIEANGGERTSLNRGGIDIDSNKTLGTSSAENDNSKVGTMTGPVVPATPNIDQEKIRQTDRGYNFWRERQRRLAEREARIQARRLENRRERQQQPHQPRE